MFWIFFAFFPQILLDKKKIEASEMDAWLEDIILHDFSIEDVW